MAADLPDRARLFVDFDKTLTTGDGGTYFTDEPEEPNDEMIEWVNQQYKSGHTIIIHSARPWHVAVQTVARLTEWGVRWHGLRLDKGGSDQYIDDKSYRPEELLDDEG